ncbi:hypothetical protein GW943_00140 [Candidatus Parcubacteria bacterium]|uniref:Orotidine 5'-phosphate decarboxylase domain-containing protein n=1 Tax=Candidatus Kaiserbacteria bacterium CG10_big_fil_rev_8_21_14_0_10_47_16 TaxID=1974608 RepID=A0A2H0UCX6_9BACT|nr:hypothetical protein [Candidatus Parcubacteria bacterium]PIR84259.1 MAG: hypothetical protein COU16_01515 [Candidatus Kaiserbacteria bacterium CG10_big_fil_rev_8_21_14_0_10_47_16]
MLELQHLTERVILSADLPLGAVPAHRTKIEVFQFLGGLCDAIEGLNVLLKVEVVARVCGVPEVLQYLKGRNVRVMLDLKSSGTDNTLLNEYLVYARYEPAIVTIDSRVTRHAFDGIKNMLPSALVLPFGLPTDKGDADFVAEGYHDRRSAAKDYFVRAEYLEAEGLLCAPRDIRWIPSYQRDQVSIVCPGVKPSDAMADSNSLNALAPTEAQRAGTDFFVFGRGVNDHPDVRGRVEQMLDLLQLR